MEDYRITSHNRVGHFNAALVPRYALKSPSLWALETMEILGYILFWVIFAVVSLFITFLLLRNIYGGKDPRNWKPQIFTKDVNFKSLFHSNLRQKQQDADKYKSVNRL